MVTATRPRFNEAAAYEFLGQLAAQETSLGYDATVDKGKRRLSPVRTVSEDGEITQAGRNQLVASGRDLPRNFAVAAWAIRKHLDFVSRFNFDCTSGVDAFDTQLEALMADASTPENWDICGRHDRCRWLRLYEARACVDGDILGVLLRSGHIQAIEADRIKDKTWQGEDKCVQGVRIDPYGRATHFQIHRRMRYSGLEFEREVAAENCVFHGYFDRFDQVRGISPLAPGINSLQDVYENFDYALAKAKISQLFGLQFTREAEEAPAPLTEEEPEESEDGPRYSVNFGNNKPILLDMDPGDKAEIIESQTPSTQFQEFTQAMIQVALKALDIPFCFFDESHTNFYGSKAAVTLYIESCKAKRAALELMLRKITQVKIRQWIVAGKLVLPAGMTVETVPYTWIHAGLPWWDPAKEIRGDIDAVDNTLRTRSEIRKERYGDDWYKVAANLRKEELYAEKIGLRLPSALAAMQADAAVAAANDPGPDPNEVSPKKKKPADKPKKKKVAA